MHSVLYLLTTAMSFFLTPLTLLLRYHIQFHFQFFCLICALFS